MTVKTIFSLEIVPVIGVLEDKYSAESNTRKELQSACFLVVLLLVPMMMIAAVQMIFPALVSMDMLSQYAADESRQLVVAFPLALLWMPMSVMFADYIHGLARAVNPVVPTMEEIVAPFPILDDNTPVNSKDNRDSFNRADRRTSIGTIDEEESDYEGSDEYETDYDTDEETDYESSDSETVRNMCTRDRRTSMCFIDEEETDYESDDDDEYSDYDELAEEEFIEEHYEKRIEPYSYLLFLTVAMWGQIAAVMYRLHILLQEDF